MWHSPPIDPAGQSEHSAAIVEKDLLKEYLENKDIIKKETKNVCDLDHESDCPIEWRINLGVMYHMLARYAPKKERVFSNILRDLFQVLQGRHESFSTALMQADCEKDFELAHAILEDQEWYMKETKKMHAVIVKCNANALNDATIDTEEPETEEKI